LAAREQVDRTTEHQEGRIQKEEVIWWRRASDPRCDRRLMMDSRLSARQRVDENNQTKGFTGDRSDRQFDGCNGL
jgi:hypothetical protein